MPPKKPEDGEKGRRTSEWRVDQPFTPDAVPDTDPGLLDMLPDLKENDPWRPPSYRPTNRPTAFEAPPKTNPVNEADIIDERDKSGEAPPEDEPPTLGLPSGDQPEELSELNGFQRVADLEEIFNLDESDPNTFEARKGGVMVPHFIGDQHVFAPGIQVADLLDGLLDGQRQTCLMASFASLEFGQSRDLEFVRGYCQQARLPWVAMAISDREEWEMSFSLPERKSGFVRLLTPTAAFARELGIKAWDKGERPVLSNGLFALFKDKETGKYRFGGSWVASFTNLSHQEGLDHIDRCFRLIDTLKLT